MADMQCDKSISSITFDSNSLAKDILSLLNNLFTYTNSNPLKSISELANALIMQKILSEMEPSLKFQITNASSFSLQYANYLDIVKSIEKFIKSNCRKEKLTLKANIVDSININQILKEDTNMLISIAQVLFFVSSICTNKDIYIDKVSDFASNLIRLYFSSIDDFIQIDSNEFMKKSTLYYLDQTSIIEKKRERYDNMIDELEKANLQLKQKIERLEKNNSDWEVKHLSKCREIEIIKKSNERSLQMQEQMLQVTLKNAELLSEVNNKNIIIEQLKESLTANANKIANERDSIQSEKEMLVDKLQDYNQLREQYNRLTIKYQDLANSKRNCEIEGLALSLEQKDKQIELFLREKNVLLEKIEKMSTENYVSMQLNMKNEKIIKQYQDKIKELKDNNDYQDINSQNRIIKYIDLTISYENQISLESKHTGAESNGDKQLKEYEENLLLMNKEKEGLKEEMNHLIVGIQEKETYINTIDSQMQSQINCNNYLTEQIKQLQSEIIELNEDKVKEVAQLECKLKQMTEELNAMKVINKRLAESPPQLESLLESKEINKDYNINTIKEKDDKIQSELKQSNQIQDTQSSLESQLKDKNNMINNLVQTIEILRDSSANVSNELKTKIELLTAEINNLNKQILALEEELENKNKEISIMQIDNSFHQNQSELLGNNYNDKFNNEIIGYEEEIRVKNDTIRKLEQKIQTLTTSLNALEAKNLTENLLPVQQEKHNAQDQHISEPISQLNLESNAIISESLFTFAYRLLNG